MDPNLFSRIEGPQLVLRLIQPEDAQYVFDLRTDLDYNRHLSEVRGTVEDQRRWIEDYKAREAELRELYYVIERSDGIVADLFASTESDLKASNGVVGSSMRTS